jgi:hypothetical protein
MNFEFHALTVNEFHWRFYVTSNPIIDNEFWVPCVSYEPVSPTILCHQRPSCRWQIPSSMHQPWTSFRWQFCVNSDLVFTDDFCISSDLVFANNFYVTSDLVFADDFLRYQWSSFVDEFNIRNDLILVMISSLVWPNSLQNSRIKH